MSVDPSAQALVAICRAAGRRVPMWTQGTGGNASVKAGASSELLWIKASGTRLDHVGGEQRPLGIACVRLQPFADGVAAIGRAADPEQAYATLLQSCTVSADQLGRPSMESGFHALLSGRWVIHLHSLAALLMVHDSFRDPQRFWSWWRSATPLESRILKAKKPGFELMECIRALPGADIYLLENHGVILQAEDGAEALARWAKLERHFLGDWGYSQLLEWSELSPEALRDKVEPRMPLRIFFPDTAVFLDRLRAALVPAGTRGGEPLWQLAPSAWREPGNGERDVAEIWLAQQLLLSARADLSELPEHIAATVANLPLELLRRGLQGRPG
jgi:ribulose-5-phosphate 4-epimerase/fuculose-1-phosphate aldolase